MSKLFAVIDIEEEKKPNASNNWLTIGSSYDDIGKKKTQPNTEKTAPNVSAENRSFFNIGQRKTAADLISSDESEESEAEKKKLKKKKKKHKKEKNYAKELDDLDRIISEDDEILNTAMELYQPKVTPLTHDTGFLYKYKMREGLCEVSILRFGEKGLYTYGFPQVKDVPAFRRLRFNLIIGLKPDKTTLALIDELNKVQGINKSIYEGVDTGMPMRRYYNTVIPKNEIIEIKRASKSNSSQLLRQDYITLEDEGNMEIEEENDSGFKLNRNEMSEKEASLLDKTREFNKKLDETPNDPILWIDFVNFQDKFHQGMVGKGASHSLVEKKLSILERAMSEKNKLENHPLLVLYHIRLLDQSNKNDDFYKVLHNTWVKYLETNQTNVVFWILFTDFKYSNFSKFSITYMRESFNETLGQIQIKMANSSNTKEIAIYKELQLYLIKKLCYFEKMAGFYERSVGIFQSLTELNIFLPETAQKIYDKTKRLGKYQEYYEHYELPRTGELILNSGWADWEKNPTKIQEEFTKGFIGIFEKSVSQASKTANTYNKFLNDVRYFIPEDIERNNSSSLLEWTYNELYSMNYWRPANTEFDNERVEESADSIVLYEDIQNYLYTVYQESFKMGILDSLFELLDLPPIFSGVFMRTGHACPNWLYSKRLQTSFDQVFSESWERNTATADLQISGIESHELFLKYPNISFMKTAAEDYPLYLSRIEYARRFLYHLNNSIPDCDSILSYIIYIESLYSHLKGSFSVEEISKSEKRMEELLKKYQKNYYLYIMYTEHVLLKDGKIDKVKKVFENLLKFVTKKKDIFIIYYFYINVFIRKDLYSRSKDHQKDLFNIFAKFACYLQGSKYTESAEITTMQLMQIQKTLTKFMSEALLKPPLGKSKRHKLYSLVKICPLNKASILVYFLYVFSNIFFGADIESSLKEYKDNRNILELHNQEKLNKNIELERSSFIKRNNSSMIDLMNLAVYRVLIYRKHSSSYVNPQQLKSFALENSKTSPKNLTLAVETIKAIYQTSLHTNQLFKLKKSLELKMIEIPYWYIVISEELRRFVVEEKERFFNLLKNYFQEFSKEETLYDQLFSEMEQKYRKKDIPVWDDCSYFQENYLYINDQFCKLFLKFISLFFPQDLKREALISLHRFPYSKDKYLSYLIPSMNDEAEVKKVFTMLLEKEIRTYKEYNL